jgi:hypothetical protein
VWRERRECVERKEKREARPKLKYIFTNKKNNLCHLSLLAIKDNH